jgi:hypothetical protein
VHGGLCVDALTRESYHRTDVILEFGDNINLHGGHGLDQATTHVAFIGIGKNVGYRLNKRTLIGDASIWDYHKIMLHKPRAKQVSPSKLRYKMIVFTR